MTKNILRTENAPAPKQKTISKILLLNPPFDLEKRYGKGISKIGVFLQPLGLCYIAANIEKHKYDVKILDAEAMELDKVGTINEIKKINPDLIGIYCNSSNFSTVLTLSKAIKEKINTKILIGGPQVTIGKDTPANTPIDYLIYGEAEFSFVELLDALNKEVNDDELKNILGIGFKNKDGKMIVNGPRPWIKDLDTLPFPTRHLLDLSLYNPGPPHYRELPYFNMTASRGCLFTCTFCSSSDIWSRTYRIRSVQNVIDEIKYLKEKYGAKDIGFWDDILGINRKWLIEFCDKMIEQNINVNWSCFLRVDTGTSEIFKKMKQAGCWCVFFGIESLDQDVLDAIDKKVKVETIKNALKWAKESGIEIRANFIVGAPAETPEKFKKSLNEIIKLNVDYVKFNVMTPYPGTRLYNQIKEGKWGEMTEEMDKLTGYFATFRPFGYKSLEEVRKMKIYAFRKFYFRPKFILNRLKTIRSWTDFERNFRGFKAILGIN
jgi:magnesium-protoporphyrin IX monomethyl ester (oxidative) cyclase